jgi:hypothetical protein
VGNEIHAGSGRMTAGGERRVIAQRPFMRAPEQEWLNWVDPCHCRRRLTTVRSGGQLVIGFGVPEDKSEVELPFTVPPPRHRQCLVEPLSKRRNLRLLLVTREDYLPAIAIRRGRST